METWSDHTAQYELSEQFSLRQADSQEWGVYYSIYYNMTYNGFFKDQGLTMGNGRRKFWIYHDSRKIGGVVVAPNVIFGLFFIPPFNDSYTVMKLLKKALLAWSDRSQGITAYEILPDQIELFSRAGFWPGQFRCRWMQRPTDHFDVAWDDSFVIRIPEVRIEGDQTAWVKEEEIVKFAYDSGVGLIDDVRRSWGNLDVYANWMKQYVLESNENLRQASTLVYDRKTDQLIGSCLISSQDDAPAVYNIAVLPAYTGRGIATKMLQRALSVLREKDEPILRLYVMQGNNAESVYYNLGFIPGPLEVQTCTIPAEG
ncbi:GNAT family N-acetyltransferase [Paenibacillaceae bacterium]|nr:GNAT family N-acetyltransferase [Paenibacillaceae bacterium]